MKTLKYLFVGAVLLGAAAPVAAQELVPEAVSAIKSKAADADKQAKAAYKKNKKDGAAIMKIAQAYYDIKDTANARVYAEYATQLKPKYGPGFVMLGDIAALAEDGGGAAKMYDQAIYFDPTNPEPYIKYAQVYRKISPTSAVSKLDDLKAHRPDIAVDALKGRIYYQSNEFERAIAEFAKADRSKMEERDLRSFAMAYYLTAKHDKALDVVEYALQKSPRDAGFNRLAFFCNTDLKNFDKALEYADRLFNQSDSAKFTYFDYSYHGNALAGAKRHEEAVAAYKKALEQEFDSNDKKAGVLKQLSEAYSNQEQYDEAIEFYQQYLKEYSTPTATDYAGLPQLHYYKSAKQEGDDRIASLKKADELYEQLAQKYPDAEEYATFWRARVNNAMDNDQQGGLAKPFYEKIVASLGDKADKSRADIARLKEAYLYLISYDARVADDMEAAKAVATKLLEIDPENAIATQVLEIK